MRLIKIIDNKYFVTVEAFRKIKLFGITVYRRKMNFKKGVADEYWINCNTSSLATKKETKKLNFWYRNHKKFIGAGRTA